MYVTFSPDEGDEQRWEFHPRTVLDDAAEAVERAFGDTWDSFVMGVFKGGIRARRVLLWHLMTREHPSLRVEDMPRFPLGALTVDLDREELGEFRTQTAKAPIDEATRTASLAWLDAQIAEAPEASDQGKAPRSKRSA